MAAQRDAAAKADEMNENMRDFAQKGVDQAQKSAEQIKDFSTDAANQLQNAASTSARNLQELSLKTLETTRSNLNAHFDFLNDLFQARSVGQAFELQSAYAKKQIEALSSQTRELSSLAQKSISDSSKPLQDLASRTARNAKSAN